MEKTKKHTDVAQPTVPSESTEPETSMVTVEIKDDAAKDPHFVESQNLHETTFKSLPIPTWLLEVIDSMGYKKPTTIQEKAIPLSMEGRDILASSQTGSGKTVAFGVPVLAKMHENKNSSCLILAPTRELAAQIKNVIQTLRGNNKIFTALLVGGEPIMLQLKQLKMNPQIIIATPGRLMDHMKRNAINLESCEMLVLDEFDRMLEMGFKEAIEEIHSKLSNLKQTLMFSATTRESVIKVARRYLNNPVEIKVGVPKDQPTAIKQDFVHTTGAKKYADLLDELSKRHGSIIIFVATKKGADNLADRLKRDGKSTDAIHGNLRQRDRERVIKYFRNQKTEILVATDVVARGIDIPHVMHVINYDMPQSLEDYSHRIGRTGRGDNTEGSSLCLVCLPEDRQKYKNIQMKLNSDEADPVDRRPPRRGEFSGGANSYSKGPRKPFYGNKNRDDNGYPPRKEYKKPYEKKYQPRKRPHGNDN